MSQGGLSQDLAGLPDDPAVAQWLSILSLAIRPAPAPGDSAERLFYLLSPSAHAPRRDVSVRVVTGYETDGVFTISPPMRIDELRRALGGRLERPGDVDAVHALERYGHPIEYGRAAFRLAGRDGAQAVEAVVKTGRVLWPQDGMHPLASGETRRLTPTWYENEEGAQVLRLLADGQAVLPLTPPWYVDLKNKRCGPLDPGVPLPVYTALLAIPPIPPERSEEVRRRLAELMPEHPEFLPPARADVEVRVVAPQPRLTIARKPWTEELYAGRRRRAPSVVIAPVGKLEFFYEGVRVRAADRLIRKAENGRVIVSPRQDDFEERALDRLAALGWRHATHVIGWRPPKGFGNQLALVPDGELREPVVLQLMYEFLERAVPALSADGWDIRMEGDPQVVREEQYEWSLGADPEGPDWFRFELGILVDGQRVPLRPVLGAAAELAERRSPTGAVEDLRDDEKVFHELPNGKVLVVPVERLKPLFRTLLELFGPLSGWEEHLRLPSIRAAEVAELDDAARQAGLSLRAPERLMRMGERLAQFERIPSVEPPPEFAGRLRPYQQSGLAWLQFLRELEFGGILADDMGLGKTVQTLAHICVEKAEGRLDLPALIVAPTSTLPNWRHEAARFAPNLRLLSWHGPQRAKGSPDLGQYDVILTSYALLGRDREALARRPFHLVVLDEAQNIKNPLTLMAKAARGLNARHRLCLTGTPVENHLEELWSIFHFLSPGLLGTITDFRRDFRTPIEKEGDDEARRRLTRRTRPFILRRTKEIVAPELPAKTEVVERVELDGPQRDLYEGVRLAMDERVRDLLATKGLARSRIEVLEALLKLRQVCGDPRLLNPPVGDGTAGSAKLTRLIEMLDELRDQGRSVLVFSQFTSMLDLIEEELRARGWSWVRISGDTVDRDTPVRRFQTGAVRLFLISLKAGGTGLNLTAADTVIHYDPWWNPAVERQATDRAHRIGQDKAVFVYKMVAEGTVEEKIVELQERKGQLAASILDGESDLAASLTADDFKWILAG